MMYMDRNAILEAVRRNEITVRAAVLMMRQLNNAQRIKSNNNSKTAA